MNSRKLLGLAAAAVVVLVLGFSIAGRQNSTPSEAEGLLYPDLKSQLGSVDAVRIYKAGDARAVELLRKNDTWTVTERAGYPADVSKLRTLLRSLTDAKLFEEKTSTAENYPSLGVEDVSNPQATGSRVEISNTKPPVNLIVGKNGPGSQSQYVRRAGEPKSWLINSSMEASTSPEAWIRKEITDISADRVQSATVIFAGAKPYTAAKKARADANFAVDGLPKGKELNSESAANSFATALTGLTLSDVQPTSAFDNQAPSAHTTIRTFDGLVVELDGWTRNDKHYVSVKPSFDQSLAERFKLPAADKKDEKQDATQNADKADSKTNPGEEATAMSARTSGWIYEIPQYKYDAIFKPLEQLLKKDK